jgi:hypothetical protein
VANINDPAFDEPREQTGFRCRRARLSRQAGSERIRGRAAAGFRQSASVHRGHALILLGIATVAFMVILEVIDPSHVSSGPSIVAFEFAGSSSRAAQIMGEWGADGRSAAHLSLVLDYGYMLSYGLFFALAGLAIRDIASERGWHRLAIAGAVIPFFALAAAAFDAGENVALLLTLGGDGGSFAPPFAAVCSAIKFTLITIAILYVLLGLAVRAKERLLQRARAR